MGIISDRIPIDTFFTALGIKENERSSTARPSARILNANLEKIERFGISRQEVRDFVPPYEHYNLEIARWAKEMQLGLVNPTPGLLAPADYTAEGDANFVSSQRILDSIWAKHRTDPKGLNGVVLLMHLAPAAQGQVPSPLGRIVG